MIETDLTMEQAMSMMMTGGAVGPETIQYSKTGDQGGDDKIAALRGPRI